MNKAILSIKDRMAFLTILLVIHVACIIIWICGVMFVTTVVFPIMEWTRGALEKALLSQGVVAQASGLGTGRYYGSEVQIRGEY